jgi:adenine C2-methylase RlmN of 23S rRNA A2503 and tRNA A37
LSAPSLFEICLPSTVRQRRGIDVNAGCGQLKAKRMAKRPAILEV